MCCQAQHLICCDRIFLFSLIGFPLSSPYRTFLAVRLHYGSSSVQRDLAEAEAFFETNRKVMTLKAAMRSSQHNKFWRIPRRKSSAALFHYVQSPPQLRKQCGSMVAMRVDGAATDPSLPLFGCRFRHFSSNDARSQAVSDTEEEESTPVVRRSPTKNKKNGHLAGAFAELAKARLSALVVGTTAAGFLAAGPYPLASDPTALAAVLMGTALCSSSAAAFNQIMEIEQDRKMKRTQHRPLVTGRLTQPQAMIAATSWSAGGTALLWLGTDPLTTALVGTVNLAPHISKNSYFSRSQLSSGRVAPMFKYHPTNTFVCFVTGCREYYLVRWDIYQTQTH